MGLLLLLLYSISSGALESPGSLLSYSIITLPIAQHNYTYNIPQITRILIQHRYHGDDFQANDRVVVQNRAVDLLKVRA